MDAQAWAPVGTTRQQLQAYFIGVSPQLQDEQYVATPANSVKARTLNKFGFQVRSTGTRSVDDEYSYLNRILEDKPSTGTA